MKKFNFIKHIVLLGGFSLIFTSCNKKEENNETPTTNIVDKNNDSEIDPYIDLVIKNINATYKSLSSTFVNINLEASNLDMKFTSNSYIYNYTLNEYELDESNTFIELNNLSCKLDLDIELGRKFSDLKVKLDVTDLNGIFSLNALPLNFKDIDATVYYEKDMLYFDFSDEDVKDVFTQIGNYKDEKIRDNYQNINGLYYKSYPNYKPYSTVINLIPFVYTLNFSKGLRNSWTTKLKHYLNYGFNYLKNTMPEILNNISLSYEEDESVELSYDGKSHGEDNFNLIDLSGEANITSKDNKINNIYANGEVNFIRDKRKTEIVDSYESTTYYAKGVVDFDLSFSEGVSLPDVTNYIELPVKLSGF